MSSINCLGMKRKGAYQGANGVLMGGMRMLAVAMLRWVTRMQRNRQKYVRVVMCWNQRYGEHIWPQTRFFSLELYEWNMGWEYTVVSGYMDKRGIGVK